MPSDNVMADGDIPFTLQAAFELSKTPSTPKIICANIQKQHIRELYACK